MGFEPSISARERAAADIRLRTHGHWDRLYLITPLLNQTTFKNTCPKMSPSKTGRNTCGMSACNKQEIPHPASYSVGDGHCFSRSKGAGAWWSKDGQTAPRLTIRGAVRLLPHPPAWCAKGKLALQSETLSGYLLFTIQYVYKPTRCTKLL